MVNWELDSNAHETSIETDVEPAFETTSIDDNCETVNNDGGLYCSPLYGGPGGSLWNDGTYSGIRRITVIVNQRTLTALQLDYGVEGDITVKDRDFRGVHHGGVGGIKIVYDLNYPEEFVTKISGYYGPIWFWFCNFVIVKSLTFHTNQRKLGPCGPEDGTYFETEPIEGKIVGMHGFGSPSYVDSVGVYMRKL